MTRRGAGKNDSSRPRSDNDPRSEEHTSELQSRQYLVWRLLLEKNGGSAVRRGDGGWGCPWPRHALLAGAAGRVDSTRCLRGHGLHIPCHQITDSPHRHEGDDTPQYSGEAFGLISVAVQPLPAFTSSPRSRFAY